MWWGVVSDFGLGSGGSEGSDFGSCVPLLSVSAKRRRNDTVSKVALSLLLPLAAG